MRISQVAQACVLFLNVLQVSLVWNQGCEAIPQEHRTQQEPLVWPWAHGRRRWQVMRPASEGKRWPDLIRSDVL